MTPGKIRAGTKASNRSSRRSRSKKQRQSSTHDEYSTPGPKNNPQLGQSSMSELSPIASEEHAKDVAKLEFGPRLIVVRQHKDASGLLSSPNADEVSVERIDNH